MRSDHVTKIEDKDGQSVRSHCNVKMKWRHQTKTLEIVYAFRSCDQNKIFATFQLILPGSLLN